MNTIRVNGELISDVRVKTNTKRQCMQASVIITVPFSHPHVELSEGYRAYLSTQIFGENAEWAADTLQEGSHLEIKKGFIRTWWDRKNGNRSFYNVEGLEIDKDRSGYTPDDYVPQNIGRFSGFFRKQWLSDVLEDGTPKVGINIAATPDIAYAGTNYKSYLSVLVYGKQAEMIDGKLECGEPIGFIEGAMQAFRGNNKVWGLYIHATDFRV